MFEIFLVRAAFRRFLSGWYDILKWKNREGKVDVRENQKQENNIQLSELLTVQFTQGKLIMLPLGEIDHHSAARLREEMDRQIYGHRPQSCCIDLQKTAFMDSAGLGLLMGRYNAAQSVGAKFCVAHPSAQIRKIITLSGMERLFTLVDEKPSDSKKEG